MDYELVGHGGTYQSIITFRRCNRTTTRCLLRNPYAVGIKALLAIRANRTEVGVSRGMINPWRWRPRAMKQKQKRNAKGRAAKSVLRLPDLEVAKSALINSLSCPDAQRGYRHAIDEFVEWYCSEPPLSFSKAVVIRYRMHLESRNLAPGTVNLRLGAVRRLAYEAADCGLLSADLAAGIRRVKGVKKLGVRLGNWLTAEQGQALWQAPDSGQMKGKRDRALLAVLLACGLRRHELATLTVAHLQQREE